MNARWIVASLAGTLLLGTAWMPANRSGGPLLYVPDHYNNLVDVFTAGIRNLKIRNKLPVVVPEAVCVDAQGNVYAVDENSLLITEFARGHKSPLRTIPTPSGFFYPSSLAVATDGSIYILEENVQNAAAFVNQIDQNGNLLRSIPLGNNGYGSLTVDRDGTLYVSAGLNVLVFAPGATSPTATIVEPGYPGGLAIDSKHELVVGIGYMNRVMFESLPSGKIMRSITTVGAGDFIALDEKNEYLYAVSASGSTLQWYGLHSGRPLGFLSGPYTQIAVDPAD